MKKVESADPGVFELRSGSSIVLILFGLPFALVGLTAVAYSLGVIPGQGPGQLAERAIVAFFGLIFVTIGAATVGGRRVIRVDRHERAVIAWWGIFVPFRTRRRQLGDSQRVLLAKEIRRSNKSSRTVYPVRISDSGGETSDLDTSMDYHVSRRLAEDVARFLHQPMVDSSSGEDVVREAAYLDESVGDRVRRMGERIELPQPPAQMRSKFQMHSGSVVIELPRTLNFQGLAGLLVATIVSGAIGFMSFGFFAESEIPGQMRLAAGAFLLLFVGIAIGGAAFNLRRGGGANKVTVNRDGLSAVQGGKTINIPAKELEELSVAGRDVSQLLEAMPDGSAVVNSRLLDSPEATSRMAREGSPPMLGPRAAGLVRFFAAMAPNAMAIVAHSDSATVSFGKGLDADELAFLCAAITKVLAE